MPRFDRGAIVVRDGQFGVVWLDDANGLVLLPIERGEAQPHDVLIDDTMPLGFAMIDARIRVFSVRIRARRTGTPASGQVQIGTLAPALVCRLMHSVAKHYAAEAEHAKWTAGEQHRRLARANAVASR